MDTNIAKPKQPQTFTDRARRIAAPFIDPIVTVLARWKFSPNTLTVLGFVGHFLAAWFVARGDIFYAGLTLMFIAPLDALDGALARKRDYKQGGFGAFLDSTLDRLAEIALFGGFLYYFSAQGDAVMTMVAYAAITGSLMVSYARGRAEGLGFDCKVGLLGRLERYLLLVFLLLFNLPEICLGILAVFTYITVGQRMHHVWKESRKRLD